LASSKIRRAEEIRRHGLKVRSKLLFCGPPGGGKTLCAEIFAAELGLPLFLVKLDRADLFLPARDGRQCPQDFRVRPQTALRPVL
jgi:hypothetical protein